MTDFHIELEIATDNCVVGIVGPGHDIDSDRLIAALEAVAVDSPSEFAREPRDLPAVSHRAMPMREAFFSASEVVSDDEAIGRISADTVAAYPPGIPNLVPGEVVTAEIIDFLKHTATQPGGWVRGALTADIDRFRVVAR